MSSLTIAWEYLTGYAVATDPSTRDRAEWPPHPARIYMALAAAWFETEPPPEDTGAHAEWATEGAALRWLESLGDPELILPEVDHQAERSLVTVYVPVNDKAGPSAASLQSCPALTRSKQPRTFPRIWVGHEVCILHWPNVQTLAPHLGPLARLCQKVTRIGHSSSLVAMRLADPAEEHPEHAERLLPEPLLGDTRARSISTGTLEMLTERYGETARRQHAALGVQINTLKGQQKAIKGKGATEAKAALGGEIERLEAERATVPARPSVRPINGLWTGYRRDRQHAASLPATQGLFDSELLVLARAEGPDLPVVSTLAVTRALRNTIMASSPQPVPEWVSGHSNDGAPLRDKQGHLALVPLPFVGHDHADGHLLGMAVVFPSFVPLPERGRVLGPLLLNEQGEPIPVRLTLGSLGAWTLSKRNWQESRLALDPNQWTAAAKGGATTWASVTPVVLDRYPKADRHAPGQRPAWEREVRAIISEACTRSGLPEPTAIDIDTTSWHLGSPRAVAKKRPLRGQTGSPHGTMALLGDGFPAYPAKGTNAPRPQIHVWLEFPSPVLGPVLLGAGRFQGYGLCKPL